MKGVPGLLIAVGLGVVGAFLNLAYLANKASEFEKVEFIAIAQRVNAGDKFHEGHFKPVSIPRVNVGNLETMAVHWSDRNTVIGEPATKTYDENEILLQKQIRTPPEMDIKKLLAADERVLWIPVDTRTFVASLVNAGDSVSFIVPRTTGSGPTPADGSEGGGERAPSSTETVGPFRILALGNRLGSQEVLRASGVMPTQENVMAVAVKIAEGEFEPKAQRVLEVMRLTNFQQVQVILHPSPDAGKGK
ncbi:MAG: hypothetical protein HY290_02340 [Planctomycetia bacterium]|nr:hypothetical protein [Planctomycetia bacterium]